MPTFKNLQMLLVWSSNVVRGCSSRAASPQHNSTIRSELRAEDFAVPPLVVDKPAIEDQLGALVSDLRTAPLLDLSLHRLELRPYRPICGKFVSYFSVGEEG